MKKILCILLIAALMSTLGCAGSPDAEMQPTAAPVVTDAPTENAADPTEAPAEDPLASYPASPVTAVVPWKVGGGADLIFRAVAAGFDKYSGGQMLLISNLEGGSSVQGVSEYMTYEPDGYNLITWGTAQTIKTHMQVTSYSVLDFEPICSFVADSPYILVRADSEFETVNDLVEYAKANPGKLTIGNSGAGGGNHLAALQFCMAAGIEANHIAYEGGAASSQATLGGEINCSMNMPAEGLSSVEAGELRMLCILSAERSAFFPEVPTAKECGIDVVNEQARGILIQKDAPEGVAEKLGIIFEQLAADETFQQQVKDLNMNFKYLNAAEYGKLLADEDAMYQDIIKANGLGDRY